MPSKWTIPNWLMRGLTSVGLLSPTPRSKYTRGFASARVNRLTSDWILSATSINSELRNDLRRLRLRARSQAHDSDYIEKFLTLMRNNIVGPHGIKLQVRAKTSNDMLDSELNRTVEAAFKRWGRQEFCTASGKLTWVDVQDLFVQQLRRDGEALIRLIAADNGFGFALKLIDVDWLDETYSQTTPTGNRIIMSVEVDANDRPIAYWLTPPVSDPFLRVHGRTRERFRVPASEIIHAHLIHDDESQARGVPATKSAMLRLRHLEGYEEAEVIAARVEACKQAFLIPPAGLDAEIADDDGRQPINEDVQPGIMQELPPGFTVSTFDPKHPNADADKFISRMLRGIAAGLGISHFSLAQEAGEVNYSTARVFLLEERDNYKRLQSFVAEHLCDQVYRNWLPNAFLAGALEGVLPRDLKTLLESANWQPRGWAWVDPEKDINAKILAINNGLETRTNALAEMGEDFEDVLAQLKKEQDAIAAAGVMLLTAQPAPIAKSGV